MDRPATIVTALYDIGRDKLIGKNAKRAFTKYLEWFKNLLSINCPMVIFIPRSLESYVLEHRPKEYITRVVIREFEELDAYKYHDRIQKVIDSMIKEPIPGTNIIPSYFKECPEFITAKYETVIFSKIDLLLEVSMKNPFNTEYFIWLDAGTFYDIPPFDVTLPWPDKYKIKVLQDKFLIADQEYFNFSNKNILADKRTYLRDSSNKLCAFILGGNKEIISKVHKDFWKEVKNALNLGVINNEQHIFQLLVVASPEDYYLWSPTKIRYTKLPRPLHDRMAVYELAQGTSVVDSMKVYPLNNDLKVLTLASKNISKDKYEKWEKSAQYFGYNYDILCRDKQWGGFNMKIRECHKRLQEITQLYTVIVDCTDAFFAGPPEELCTKFINTKQDIIVGCEMDIHYNQGKYPKPTMSEFFGKIKKSEQMFPNGGFIIGKTESLIKLFEKYIEYKDDQAAYFDAIYEGYSLGMDYNTSLVGNVPNYHEHNDKAINYYTFDEKLRRYRNVHNGETPVFLHFPGGNWIPMNEFYNNIHSAFTSNSISITNTRNTNNYIWVFLVIFAMVIIIILIWLYLR